jgi:hypothetical protein
MKLAHHLPLQEIQQRGMQQQQLLHLAVLAYASNTASEDKDTQGALMDLNLAHN